MESQKNTIPLGVNSIFMRMRNRTEAVLIAKIIIILNVESDMQVSLLFVFEPSDFTGDEFISPAI